MVHTEPSPQSLQ